MLILYLLFVTPVALAALWFDHLASERLRTDVQAADLSLARAVALKTDAELARAIHTVEELSAFPAVVDSDPAGMEDLFQAVAASRPEVNLIYRLGADGTMLFHYPLGPGSTLGDDFSFREYFHDARATLDAVVSKGRISPTTNQAVATTVMPVVIAGEFDGVVATNIRLQSLSQVLEEIAGEFRPEDGFRISIVDASGQIVADPDPTRLLVGIEQDQPSAFDLVLAQRSDSFTTADSSGQRWVTTIAPIPSAAWGVVISRPEAVAFSTARSFHTGLLVTVGLFLALGLFFWLALFGRIIRPLEIVSSFAKMIGNREGDDPKLRGEISALAQRPDHMGYLSRSISQMEASIQRRLRELEMLLETSRDVVSSLDLQTVLDRILDQTGRLLGANMCSIVAFDEVSGQFSIRASRGLSPGYIRRLRIDPSTPNSPTMRAIRSGQPIHIQDTETDPSFKQSRTRARAEGYRALLAVPLLTQHASAAALLAYFDQPRQLSRREIDLVMNFANHAAMAIENATLFARSDEQLQEQTRRLEALIESMADGLILEDLKGKVLYCNRRFLELAQLDSTQLASLTAPEVRQSLYDRCDEGRTAGQAMESVLSAPSEHSFELNLRQNGRAVALRVQTFAVTDPSGTVVGRGQLFQDISDYRELDRMKNSLIATVSHELRTPLASIKGFATTLLARDVQWNAAAQREFLEVISQESDRLSALVTDLLDLSRLEAGTLRVNRSMCDLKELIQEVARSLGPPMESRLQLRVPTDLPPVALDRRRIEVVIRNLLQNAAKYGGPNAAICMTAKKENGDIRVSVEDDGPGIPADYNERVFEPFFRIEGGLARSVPGAGLGLSISRGFVEAHGGRIWLENRGATTCVSFTLPLEDPK